MPTPYTCPRCGYESCNKTKMHVHFERKKMCPGLLDHTIRITQDVKDFVLENRIYKPKKEPEIIKHITIQNAQINQINQYFNKMDLGEKVTLLDIQNMTQCSDKVLSLVERETEFHRNDTPGFILEDKDVEDLVGKLCRSQKDDMSDMNVLVDLKANRMMIYDAEEWSDLDLSSGARKLVTFIHENFMNEHERYLLRCHKNSRDIREKQDIKEQIVKYYRIVVAFDLEPYCFNRTDDDIFDNGSRFHDCEEEFYPKFRKVSETMTMTDKRAWINLINATIKSNSKVTTMALNKKLFELSQKDDPGLKRALGV